MRSLIRVGVFALSALVVTAVLQLGTVRLFGQQISAAAGTTVESARVPLSFIHSFTPRTGDREGQLTRHRSSSSFGVPGIDSLVNFTDQFTADGFDSLGNPQSVWPYEMVGAPPESGLTTFISAPIIPVTVELLDAAGHVAVTAGGSPLRTTVTPDILNAVGDSPVFQPFTYTSGTGQFTDQMMRAQFADRLHHGGHGGDSHDDGWHTILRPRVKTTRVLQLPFGSYHFATNADGTCCAFVLADFNTFANALFPATVTDTTTPIGAAEHADDMRTRDISTLLFNNVYLYDGSVSNCCVLGFHSYDLEPGDAHNGNREKRYVMDYASWITNGFFSFGTEDITAFSHEMAELFADPFVDNATPWWLSVDPSLGFALCQNNLEVGDVIEVLTGNPVFPVSMNGRTYHPQNEALLPWFAFQSPSPVNLGAYSFPDETTLTSLSPAGLMPGCTP